MFFKFEYKKLVYFRPLPIHLKRYHTLAKPRTIAPYQEARVGYYIVGQSFLKRQPYIGTLDKRQPLKTDNKRGAQREMAVQAEWELSGTVDKG